MLFFVAQGLVVKGFYIFNCSMEHKYDIDCYKKTDGLFSMK